MSSDPRLNRATRWRVAIEGRLLVSALVLAALLSLLGAARGLAQQPPPPTPTPTVVTATPVPQIVVVTATPSAPPAPKTFWGEYGDNVLVALIALISGVILTPLLRPLFERLGEWFADTAGQARLRLGL